MKPDTIVPIYLGLCANQTSREVFCGRRIFDDSFYEIVDGKLICEPCVEALFNHYIEPLEDASGKVQARNRKATVKSDYCGSIGIARVRKLAA